MTSETTHLETRVLFFAATVRSYTSQGRCREQPKAKLQKIDTNQAEEPLSKEGPF
ncbi:hypothetical protein M758_4G154300 [Ceratodon purpureus]|nr:hypothetical protein M758_4G154300 [Ceratodon purpureus]